MHACLYTYIFVCFVVVGGAGEEARLERWVPIVGSLWLQLVFNVIMVNEDCLRVLGTGTVEAQLLDIGWTGSGRPGEGGHVMS